MAPPRAAQMDRQWAAVSDVWMVHTRVAHWVALSAAQYAHLIAQMKERTTLKPLVRQLDFSTGLRRGIQMVSLMEIQMASLKVRE